MPRHLLVKLLVIHQIGILRIIGEGLGIGVSFTSCKEIIHLLHVLLRQLLPLWSHLLKLLVVYVGEGATSNQAVRHILEIDCYLVISACQQYVPEQLNLTLEGVRTLVVLSVYAVVPSYSDHIILVATSCSDALSPLVYLSTIGKHVVTLVVPLLLQEFSLRVLCLHDANTGLGQFLALVISRFGLLTASIDCIPCIIHLIPQHYIM